MGIIDPLEKMGRGDIQDPVNYYQGLDVPGRIFSRGILVFERLTREALQQKHLTNRMHSRYVLMRVLEAGGVVSVDGKSLPLVEGDVLLVAPYQFHHYISVARERLRWMFITFELAQGEGLLGGMGHRVLRVDAVAERCWGEIVDLWQSRDRALRGEALPILDRLLMRLRPRSAGHNVDVGAIGSSGHDWLARIEGLLIRSVREGWTLEEVARRAKLSERHLRTRFEAVMGVSLRDYRANYQLNLAISLMRDSALSLSNVAELSGFNSQPAFTRFIKRMAGVAPSELRARLRDGTFELRV